MNPEEQVKQFLEQVKPQHRGSAYVTRRIALARYLEYLRVQGKETILTQANEIDEYRTHLYQARAHHSKTVWQYVQCLMEFYDYLKERGLVKENPVRPHSLKTLLKERYYTDQEIYRSYVANWRKIYTSTSRIEVITRAWKRISAILKKLKARLQTLEPTNLKAIGHEIDQYPNQYGTRLGVREREETLAILKGILRWMHRNGYTRNDLSWNLRQHWTIETIPVKKGDDLIDEIWKEYEKRYLEAVQVRLRPSTCQLIHRILKWFWRYLTEVHVKDIHGITQEVLEGYQSKIYERKHLAQSTRSSILCAAKYFMGWLEKTDQILLNPCHRILWPQKTRGLPTRLMSEHDVKTLMNGPDTTTPYGLRARAVFELMYSTGSRAQEASGVRIEDIDFENGLLKIQEPKGGPNYQRVIPIGQSALFWIKKYLKEAREHFSPNRGYERLLFLTAKGQSMNAKIISCAMRYTCLKLGMRKLYSSHSWRVTCATAMLKNKADIRHVQEQLGHRSLESTQRYTRLMPMDLKKVHEKTHPREREYRRHLKL